MFLLKFLLPISKLLGSIISKESMFLVSSVPSLVFWSAFVAL